MPAENDRPSVAGTNSTGQDESVRADEARAEPVRPTADPVGVSMVRWSQRHSEAARAARASGARGLSNGYVTTDRTRTAPDESTAAPVPDSIVHWSRRHSGASEVAVAGEGVTSEPAGSSAAGQEPALPPSQVAPSPSDGRRGRVGVLRRGLHRSAGLLALLGWLIALLMVLYILFVVLRANPLNPWAAHVETWAPRLNLGLGGLDAGANATVSVLVSYGLAAILWATIGTVASWLIRRVAAP